MLFKKPEKTQGLTEKIFSFFQVKPSFKKPGPTPGSNAHHFLSLTNSKILFKNDLKK